MTEAVKKDAKIPPSVAASTPPKPPVEEEDDDLEPEVSPPSAAPASFTAGMSDNEIRQHSMELAHQNAQRENNSNAKRVISPVLTCKLVEIIDSVSGDLKNELLHAMHVHLLVTDSEIADARNELKAKPDLFASYQTPKELADSIYKHQKPASFFAPPAMTIIPANDGRYWPNRFVKHPADYPSLFETLEDGDIIYSTHEDGTFFILSKEQQTVGFQSQNHMPRCNLIEVLHKIPVA